MAGKHNGLIVRPRIKRILDDMADEKIIYVCSSAGYGKTVAIRQWLEAGTRAHHIISLDEYDNNPAYFCERFCTALHNCQPTNAVLSEISSHPAFDSAPVEFTLRAISALCDKKSVAFVMDDMHFIHDEKVLRMLLAFLKRFPKNFQIVLISRNDLPFGFSDLWLRGQLARVAIDQLRFNEEEILLLCKKRGVPMTMKQAEQMERYTGGWAIGINALLLSGGETSGESMTYLDEIIRSDIWDKWSPDIRAFMLNTAVVREMTPSLCAALTDNPDSERILNELVKQNAFIAKDEHNVYRYHRLFHDYLTQMLAERGEAFTRALLAKAGGWYLAEHDFHNAITYFIQCENYEGIAQCIGVLVTQGREFVPTETLYPIARLPVVCRAAEKYPYLYSLLAWSAYCEGRVADMAEYSDRYYANQAEIVRINPELAHSIILVSLVDFRNSLHALTKTAGTITMTPTENKLNDMRTTLGTLNQNLPLLHRGTRDFSECAVGNTVENISCIISAIDGLFGDEARLLEECLVAGLLYEQGHLEKACRHALAANAEIKAHFTSETKFFAMAVLYYIQNALGKTDQVALVAQRIADMIDDAKAYYLHYNFNAMQTRRELAKGDINAANRWLKEYEPPLYNGLDFYKSYGHITTCRAYITKGEYDSAAILLQKMLELAAAYNRPLDIIESQMLLSIAYWKKKRGFQKEAMPYLEQAVATAYQYGYTQIFINDGAELCGMLHRLQKSVEQRGSAEIVPPSFIKMLYIKTQESHNSGLTSGQAHMSVTYTDKQKAVMKLLCEGKNYREITEILGIKRPTLRSHIALIYQKLDVTSEMDAIKKIEEQGLLEDSVL